MKRTGLDKRREYVKKRIEKKAKNTTTEAVVNAVAKELFLSPRTVWNDYAASK